MLRFRGSPILQSTVLVALITILAKLLGYLEKFILAYYFGTGYEVDVYNLLVSVILGFFFLFREIAEPVFLNIFIKLKEQEGLQRAWNFLNSSLRYVLIAGLGLTVIVIIFPGLIPSLFAPGFDARRNELAVELARIAFPGLVFLLAAVLTNIALNGVKRFALPAMGDLAFKLGVVLAVVLLYRYWNIYAAATGFLVGAFLKLLSHWLILYREISFRRLTVQRSYAREILQVSWPLILGSSVSQAATFADNILASYLQTGSIAAIGYARKLVEMPVLIFPYVLSVVVFPYFSQFHINNQKDKLVAVFAPSMAWIAMVFLPLSVFFCLFSVPVIELVFGHGAFDRQSVLLTAAPFKWYAAGMLFSAIETVLVIFYFANGNLKFPVKIGVICVIEHLLISFLFIQWIGYIAIPLAFVAARATKVCVLLFYLNRLIPVNRGACVQFIAKIFTAAAVLALAIVLIKPLYGFPETASTLKKLIVLSTYFCGSFLLYGIVLYLFGINKKLLPGRAGL